MTDRVFDIRDFLTTDGEEAANDSFLLEEGLDLLATYRAIPDRDLRLAVMRLIAAIAQAARQELGDRA